MARAETTMKRQAMLDVERCGQPDELDDEKGETREDASAPTERFAVSPRRWPATLASILIAWYLIGTIIAVPLRLHHNVGELVPKVPAPVLLACVVGLGATVMTVAGFGMAAFCTAPVVLVLGSRLAAPFVAVMAMVMDIVMMVPLCRDAAPHWRHIAIVTVVSVITNPLGVMLADRIITSGVSHYNDYLISALLMVIVFAKSSMDVGLCGARSSPHWSWPVLFGAVAGVTMGAFNITGPVYVILAQLQGWDKTATRACLPAIATPAAVVTVASRWWLGHFDELDPMLLVFSAPAMMAGYFIGSAAAGKLDEVRFSRFVQLVIGLMAVQLLLARARHIAADDL